MPADANETDLRWADCSSLKPGTKAITFGTLIDDAHKVYGWPKAYLQRDKTSADSFTFVLQISREKQGKL